MNQALKLGGILLAFAAVASGALSMVDSFTRPRIEAYDRLQQQLARKAVLPAAALFRPGPSDVEPEHFLGLSAADTSLIVGYTYLCEAIGYSSTIQTIVGVDTDFNISGVKVTSQFETPGLGAKLTEVRYGETTPWFQVQFEGLSALTVAVEADGGEINAITGATISSRAVADAVRRSAAMLRAGLPPGLQP